MQIKRPIYAGLITGFVIAASMMVSSFLTSALAGPNCTCRFAGQNFKTGAVLCIRGKLSRCEFVLNNTSWKVLAQTCPQVMVPNNLDQNQSLPHLTLLARLKSRLKF